MNDRKHVVVGLFALGALVLLGLLIIWFQGVAGFVRGGYIVRGHLPNSRGVRVGKRVHKDGIEIGDVREVVSSQPERPGVWVRMRIDPDVRVPAEARLVAQASTVGDVFLDFTTEGVSDPTRYLPNDGSASVDGVPKAPSLLPEDLMTDFRKGMESLDDLKALVANLKELTEPPTEADLPAVNLWDALRQFDTTAKAIQSRVEDKNLDALIDAARTSAADLAQTLAEARAALATVHDTATVFQTTGTKANDLFDRIHQDADQARALIQNLNGFVSDVRAGKGTLGQLVADDELHRLLCTLVENLNTVAENTDRLVTMLRKEGLFAKEE